MLSRKMRYALMSLSILAREYGGESVPMSRIASERHVPQRFLEGIFLQLRNAGILASDRGASGGYKLCHPPGEVKILDIVLALGENVDMVSCLDICGESYDCEFGLDRDNCRIRFIFEDVQALLHNKFIHYTLQDLI